MLFECSFTSSITGYSLDMMQEYPRVLPSKETPGGLKMNKMDRCEHFRQLRIQINPQQPFLVHFLHVITHPK